MAMSSYLQEAPLGQIIRWATGNKVFRYPEEEPGFKIPWEGLEESEKEAINDAPASKPRRDSSASENTPHDSPGADEKADPIIQPDRDTERGLSTIPTQASSAARRVFTNATARTKSREQTTQYTSERFEIEQQEALERRQTSIIAPQKTADGITLVDWYTTDDKSNPQNWNSWYKVFVVFQIFLYTFGVYASSAIYTPATEQVMAKFGVSISEASTGLSIYVIGYGLGPLVSLSHLYEGNSG